MAHDPTSRKVTPLAAHTRVSKSAAIDSDSGPRHGELMARVASEGDVEAFLDIHDHYAPRLKRYLLGLGVAPATADDLVQESMIRLWRHAGAFDPVRASLSTWLFRIARNLHIDAHRRASLRDGADDLWEIEDAIADDDGVEPDAYADHVGLDRAIDALPANEARLIRMSYLEARSHSEIASELGMPLGSVKSTLRRAFGRLKATLGVPA